MFNMQLAAVVITVSVICSDAATFKRIVDKINKPDRDDRDYRGLELENGLKALVISDPKTDVSSAAMQVDVGMLSDPWELQGLAHFCEHMLFLGTEKYPDENDYQKYVAEHGGYTNAFTAMQQTVYFFTINPENLDGAIDRFAQFFISPLMNESSVEREVNAVNSEFQLSLKEDNRRIFQVQRTLAKPEHDFTKFGVGSKETLLVGPRKKGLNPREEVLKFHSKWYSSNIMQLVILGKESTDQLSDMVLKYFSDIKNKNVTEPSWSIPFGKSEVKRFVKVDTIKEKNDLSLEFPIPDIYQYYQSKPQKYINYLLNNEGVGSIASYLKRKGWIESLTSEMYSIARGFGSASIGVELTNEGEKHIDEISQSFFQFIAMMKELGPQKRFYEEAAKIAEIEFKNKDKSDPVGAVISGVENLRFYPIAEVLDAEYLMPKYEPEQIRRYMSFLNADNVLMFRFSNKFKDDLDTTEKWYGTKYAVAAVQPDLLNKLEKPGKNPEFKLPPPNEFIPSDISLKKRDEINGKHPELILSNDFMHAWYHQDKKYLIPKAFTFIRLTSPYANLNPLHYKMTELVAQLVADSLIESLWPASVAGLYYDVSHRPYGIHIGVNGYTEKQGVLVGQIMEKIASFDPSPERFTAMKEAMVRNLNNFNVSRGLGQAFHFMSSLLRDRIWSVDQFLKELDAITIERLKQYVPIMLSEVNVAMFGSGNILLEDVKKMAETVQSVLQKTAKSQPFPIDSMPRRRAIIIPPGEDTVFQAEHPVAPDTAVIVYMQCNESNMLNNLKIGLLGRLFREPIFDDLRTKQQLGYIVGSAAQVSGGMNGLRIIIQSARKPNYVTERIDEFLSDMSEMLGEMSSDEFEKHKKAFATERFEEPKQLAAQSGIFWGEIASEKYNFDRRNLEKEMLKDVTLKDLQALFKEFIDPTNPERRRLSLYVLGSKAKEDGYTFADVCKKEEITCLEKGEQAEFVKSHKLGKLQKPYKAIEEFEKECPRNCKKTKGT